MSIEFEAAKSKVAALVTPRNVVLVGATDRAGAWAAKVWNNLSRISDISNTGEPGASAPRTAASASS